jgi:hypothetical protein
MHALALMWAQNENSFQGLEVQLSLAKLSVASFNLHLAKVYDATRMALYSWNQGLWIGSTPS